MKKVFIFDWDGTIFDSMEVKSINAGLSFAELYGHSSAESSQMFRELSGESRFSIFNKISHQFYPEIKFSDQEFRKQSELFSKLNMDSALSGKSKLFNDTFLLLQELNKSGHSLYISSHSTHHELSTITSKLGVQQYFKGIYGAKDHFLKGDDHFNHIQHKEKCSRSDLIFLGDEREDLELGRKCKIRTFLINRKAQEETTIINDEQSISLTNFPFL